MSNRKTTSKKKRRRRRQSKTERFFGAVVLEGLGVIAVIAMFFYARRATQPQIPTVADVNPHEVVSFRPEFSTSHSQPEWRSPDSGRFDQRLNQTGYFPSSR
jgi:cytoskeletal protein RodZ